MLCTSYYDVYTRDLSVRKCFRNIGVGCVKGVWGLDFLVNVELAISTDINYMTNMTDKFGK